MAYNKQPFESLDFVTENELFEDDDDFGGERDSEPSDDQFFAMDDTDDALLGDDFDEDDLDEDRVNLGTLRSVIAG